VIADKSQSPDPARTVPRWFARLLVVLLAAVVGYGATGLVLALAGVCTPLMVGVVGTPAVMGLGRLGWSLDPTPSRPAWSAWSIGALVLALGSIVFNAPNAGEHVVVNRDPGVYLVAGRWIAGHGTLVVDAGTGPFGTADDVLLESSGTYDEGGGRLDLQFNHLVPVLLAEAHWLGGDRLMVILPVLIGAAALLTTFALAARLTGRAWAGFLVAATLSTSLPVLAVVRDTYSEPAAWLLVTGGLWLWTRAADEARIPTGALGGLALGAVAMARIDGIVYLLPVPAIAGVLAASLRTDAGRRLRRTALMFSVSIIPAVVISAVDLLLRSREYYRDLEAQIITLWAALACLAVVGWMIRSRTVRSAVDRAPGLRSWAVRHRRMLATGAASAVVIGGIFAWLVRPQVQVVRSARPFEYIGAMQAAEGQPVDPARRYDERSLGWVAWYVGPLTVALAVIGGALVVHRSIARGITPANLSWLVLGGGTVLYLWRPGITPDQIWATRRFVPAVLPLLVMLAAVSVVAAVEVTRRQAPHVTVPAMAVGTALSLGVIAPAVAQSLPVAGLSDQHGYLDLAYDLCANVSGGAVLAVVGERAGIGLPQTVRSFCDVPAGVISEDGADPQHVAALAAEWAAEERKLHVIASSVEVVESLIPGVAVTRLGPYENDQMLEVTVTRPPRRLVEVSETLYLATVPRHG
jgi:hypothetical protein